MKVSTLMEKPVISIEESALVQTAAETMGKKRIGSLIVTKGQAIVGIITERDIMSKVIAEKRDLENVKVKEVMSTPIVTVSKDMEGETVLKIMAEKGVRKVLVTEKTDIVGIFSTSDITKLAIN
jgi:CBS domain-containing protein